MMKDEGSGSDLEDQVDLSDNNHEYRVGMYTNLTKKEAETECGETYTRDFFEKPDPVGTFIFSKAYRQAVLLLCFLWIIFFVLAISTQGNILAITSLATFTVILQFNFILLAYRCCKYSPFCSSY